MRVLYLLAAFAVLTMTTASLTMAGGPRTELQEAFAQERDPLLRAVMALSGYCQSSGEGDDTVASAACPLCCGPTGAVDLPGLPAVSRLTTPTSIAAFAPKEAAAKARRIAQHAPRGPPRA